ncbi:MAG: aminoacetone oxidase family FAD-binding enzyme, partial [Lentisphaeria bacterium]|nr:aminoacetone oxidase family FAD-binding enzyme [Lentisphaeria bacterium]
MTNKQNVDMAVVGAGPAGLMVAITASRTGQTVTLLERMREPGMKLLASGGGRCNLTNTLTSEQFVERCGRHARFMLPALRRLDSTQLRAFFTDLGVPTHAPDGFRVFPVSHSARDVRDALLNYLSSLGATPLCDTPVVGITRTENEGFVLRTPQREFRAARVVLACGGAGHPNLGGGLTGYELAESLGHAITPLAPAMVPLVTREDWPARCRAHTIPNALLEVKAKGRRGLRADGDLIFTETGLAGPLVLDVAREITPMLEHGAVYATLRLTGRSEEWWTHQLTTASNRGENTPLGEWLEIQGVPPPLAEVFAELADLPPSRPVSQLGNSGGARLARLAGSTPIEFVSSEGFAKAMVTRGGVAIKSVDPKTLESRLVPKLFFAGEMLDLDGPCGGFNLQ